MPIQSHRHTIKHVGLAVCFACTAASAADKASEALFAESECLWILIEKLFHLVLLNTFLLLSLVAATLHIVDVLSLELS